MGKQAAPVKGKGRKAADLELAPIQPPTRAVNHEDAKDYFREQAQQQISIVDDPFQLETVAKRAAFYKLGFVEASDKVFEYFCGKNYDKPYFMAHGIAVVKPGTYENYVDDMKADLYLMR